MENKKNRNLDNFRDLSLQEERLISGIKLLDKAKRLRVLKALDLAKESHKGQKRIEGDPYIIHPTRVANIIIYELKITDADIIISGLLHDVVEDTNTSIKKVDRQFGKRVGRLVLALTRDKDKETKREKFEKTLRGPQKLKLLKACDWLDNLRSVFYLSRHSKKRQGFLQEAKEMYIPLAKSTGNKWLIAETKKALLRCS